jgi:hypothetical protein
LSFDDWKEYLQLFAGKPAVGEDPLVCSFEKGAVGNPLTGVREEVLITLDSNRISKQGGSQDAG